MLSEKWELFVSEIRVKQIRVNQGLGVLALFSFVLGFSIIGSRMGWVDFRYGGKYDLYMFLNLCFLPLVFPIIYFLFRPKCFTNAIRCLKDM